MKQPKNSAFRITPAEHKQIDAIVAQRLREDADIGRWVRETASSAEHVLILDRARRELKFWRRMRERYNAQGVCRG